MRLLLLGFWRDEAGQDLIEYGLLAAFIALFLIVAVQNVGTALDTFYGNMDDRIPTGAAS